MIHVPHHFAHVPQTLLVSRSSGVTVTVAHTILTSTLQMPYGHVEMHYNSVTVFITALIEQIISMDY